MEDNRINRRARPRPYDLRRKVLLKNFLRDQMTHISEFRLDSVTQNNNASFSEESSVPEELNEELASDENSSSPSIDENSMDISDTSNNDKSDHACESSTASVSNIDKSVTNNSSSDSPLESSLLKFTSIVKFKKNSKKPAKGIVKAKQVCKSSMKTRSFKSGLERIFYGRKRPSVASSSKTASKNSSRSLFSLFKHRKDQRNTTGSEKVSKSPVKNESVNASNKLCTINQSVQTQTDDSWTKSDIVKVQESNIRLKEENKLLSQSLSYFMSNASMDPQIRQSSRPLQSANKNINAVTYPDYNVAATTNRDDNWSLRPKVARSKSLHEYGERRNIFRNNYRTRSMNCHNIQNNIPSSAKTSLSSYSTRVDLTNIRRERKNNLLSALRSNNPGRSIQRRSSMPERPLAENNRSAACRRSGSVRDTRSRTPFYDLPTEAFY